MRDYDTVNFDALTYPQKAAVVIVALGAERASELYQHMDHDDIEALTREIARLRTMSSGQIQKILAEFYQFCLLNKAITEDDLDYYARTVLGRAFLKGDEIGG